MFSSASHLQVHVAQDARHLMVLPVGEIDHQTSPLFRRAMASSLELGATSLTVHASAIDFIDASGLHALVALHRRMARHGGRFEVIGATPGLRRLVSLADLGYLLAA